MTKTTAPAAGHHKGRLAVIVLVLAMALVSGISLFTNLTHWPLGLADAQPAKTVEGLDPLTLTTASGAHRFEVEVMRTDAERERGLMERRYMPPDRGMLFDFGRDEQVAMWMKNTYIPLDMIFIRRDGTVSSVAADTEPLSERTIESGGKVRAVLEVNAGTAARIGLKPGDRVTHAMFPK